jgi:DICT domain-containing protein
VGAVKDFSMYECALGAASGRALVDLGAVAAVSRQTFDEHTTFRCRTQPPCLEYLSLLIETAILLRAHRGGRVYIGFERLSRMEPIVARFLRIADVSERLYVFGEPDWQPPRHPHMKALKVPADAPLAREWFVIADSPTLQVALVAYDNDSLDAPVIDARNFDAIKSHDPHIVAQLAAAAERLVDIEVRG